MPPEQGDEIAFHARPLFALTPVPSPERAFGTGRGVKDRVFPPPRLATKWRLGEGERGGEGKLAAQKCITRFSGWSLTVEYINRDEAVVHNAWVAGAMADLAQGDGSVYVNFLADEGEARVRDAYPNVTWERLAAIKAKYDPTNLFHRNQNIAPKAE